MIWLKEYKLLVIAALAGVLLVIYLGFQSKNELSEVQKNSLNEEILIKKEEIEEKVILMADVKGEVAKPGVYFVEDGDRVTDLIEKAGGLTEEADSKAVNLAMRVTDEMAVYIPKIGEETERTDTSNHMSTGTGETKINLNRDPKNELEKLPGIGPAKAEAIIEYREKNGRFQTIDDIKKITGIGDKTFEKLKDLISVE